MTVAPALRRPEVLARCDLAALPGSVDVLLLYTLLCAILPVQHIAWSVLDDTDVQRHLAAAVSAMSPFLLETALSRAVEIRQFEVWAFVVTVSSGALAAWMNGAVAHCDQLGPLGSVITEAVVPPGVTENVLHALMMCVRCLHLSFGRLQADTGDSDLLESDLAGVLRGLTELAALRHDSPAVASHLWPVLADVHHSHLGEVAPDTVVQLVQQLVEQLASTATSEAAYLRSSQCLTFLAHWIAGFGLSIERVWSRPGERPCLPFRCDGHLRPKSEAIQQLLQCANGAAVTLFEGAVSRPSSRWGMPSVASKGSQPAPVRMSSTDNWGATFGIWVAVSAGIVTAVATLYGIYREWQAYRQNQTVRLSNAAMVAVRRAEANVVRPLLRDRMAATVQRVLETTSRCVDETPSDSARFRARLFCELHSGMRLTEAEKRTAHTTATNNLIAALRVMPSPPLRVDTDEQVTKHDGLLQELAENAYSTRLRPSVDLLQQLSLFIGVVGVPTPPQA